MIVLKNSLILLIVLFSGFFASASELFDQGLKQANAKEYSKAIETFEKLIETEKGNVSAYFNLGNCYYENKQYGKAILAYERVLKFSPRDSEAPMNIELCYKKLGSNIIWEPHTNGIQRLIYGVGPNTWAYLALFTSFLLAFSIFSFFRTTKSSWKRLLFFLIFGKVVLLIAFIIAAKSASSNLTSEQFALVTKEIIPTYMNDQGEKAQLQLQEGTKLEIIQSTKTNIEVRLQDGRAVLVDKVDVEII